MMPAVRRTERLLQRLQVDVAVRQRGDFDDCAAAHRRGRGIGAVRGIRNDDLGALHVAARAVIRADHRDAGELALRARHRRQRDALHAGDFLQHLLQLEHAGEEALADRLRRERMPAEELRQHRELIARARVVFHRARAERIEVRVDREVQLRQAREVAHCLQLRHFRQRRRDACGGTSPALLRRRPADTDRRRCGRCANA